MAPRRTKAAAPRPVEPGEMKRGKLFRLDKGWVWVTPYEMTPEQMPMIQDYWKGVSDDALVVLPSTDLLIGEDGHLYVKDVAMAFPEEPLDAE